MATYSGIFDNNGYTLYLDVTESNVSIANNTSVVNWTLRIVSTKALQYGSWDLDGTSYSVTIDGEKVASGSKAYDFRNYQKLTIASGSKTITHNPDGSRSVVCSASFGGSDTPIGDASASGTMALSNIPRYANITGLSVKSKTETSITLEYTTDKPAWLFTRINGGEWLNDGEPFVSNTTSGTFTINYKDKSSTQKLDANTTYNITVLCRALNRDSELDTYKEISATTFDYPHCTDSPNFIIGNPVTLTFYNPLNRHIGIELIGEGETLIGNWEGTGTSISGFNHYEGMMKQYNTIPNSQSGRYKVKVVYGSSTKIRDNGNTYSIRGNEVPTINGFDYIDNNPDMVKITGDETKIVQNHSILLARFHSATPNYGAGSISQYYIECNGRKANENKEGAYSLGTIDSSNNVDLTLTVVDSRGLSASKTIKVTMLSYSPPTFTTYLKRKNNYEDETYLKVDGSVSSVDGKNKIEVLQYRYRLSTGNYDDKYYSIEDNKEYTLNLDKNNMYMFEIILKDTVGTIVVDNVPLGKGVFPLFIDVEKNSVAVNRLPIRDGSFEIDGDIYAGDIKCKNLLYTPYTENNKLTHNSQHYDEYWHTGYKCYLEVGKTYTFSCETDTDWAGVEVYLLKDDTYQLFYGMDNNPHTFAITETGYYYLRVDFNNQGQTYSYWNFQVEEGSVKTEFVEAKEFSNKQHYTTGEQVIGTWIDGKPLYRKVVTSSERMEAGLNETPHGISNISTIKSVDAIQYFPDEGHFPFPLFYSNPSSVSYIRSVNDTNIVIYCGENWIGTTYIILEYTKSTD